MALSRIWARDLTITQHIIGFLSSRLSLTAQQRFYRDLLSGEKYVIKVPVETDVTVLRTEVCGTKPFVEGDSNIKLKPDSHYPEWLWELHLGPPLQPHQMDKNSKEYWECININKKNKKRYLDSLILCKRDYK